MSAEVREPFWSNFSATVGVLLMFFLLSSNQVHGQEGPGEGSWKEYDGITDRAPPTSHSTSLRNSGTK
ncbi:MULTISPECIES: hypothetical protein [Microbulbifer]|uniref:Uncharacterized protein n=1 Tax=Microbulbifer celer TaxID=435905 RepID=A0ABW3U559_9GAMM|nr:MULTISPECIES: hypothetical protein [Microbulbifer]